MNQFVPFAHYTAMARPAVAASATFTRIVAGATSRRAAEVRGPAETGNAITASRSSPESSRSRRERRPHGPATRRFHATCSASC
jgi:hypothetical protein